MCHFTNLIRKVQMSSPTVTTTKFVKTPIIDGGLEPKKFTVENRTFAQKFANNVRSFCHLTSAVSGASAAAFGVSKLAVKYAPTLNKVTATLATFSPFKYIVHASVISNLLATAIDYKTIKELSDKDKKSGLIKEFQMIGLGALSLLNPIVKRSFTNATILGYVPGIFTAISLLTAAYRGYQSSFTTDADGSGKKDLEEKAKGLKDDAAKGLKKGAEAVSEEVEEIQAQDASSSQT